MGQKLFYFLSSVSQENEFLSYQTGDYFITTVRLFVSFVSRIMQKLLNSFPGNLEEGYDSMHLGPDLDKVVDSGILFLTFFNIARVFYSK